MSPAPLVVDASTWTGRRLTREERVEAGLACLGVFPIDREAVPPLHAEVDAIAAALGVAPPRLFFRPEPPLFMAGAAAAVNVRDNTMILTRKALKESPDVLRGLLAHELAHVACGHGANAFCRWFCCLHRYVALVALGVALVLGSLPLILAALVALAASHWAALHVNIRDERQADAIAVRFMGSVILLLPDPAPKPWRERLWAFWACYPARRPWMHEWASAELIAMHNHIAKHGRHLLRAG